MVSPLVRPSDWSYPREFGKRESERFAAGSRHNEPRCMRGRIYTPGALYVARAGTATKRDAPLMMKVEPADFIAFRPPPSLSRHSIPLGIFNTRCFSIFSLLPFETLSSTRCCSRTLEFSRAEKERERGRGRGKKAETRRGNVYKYIYIRQKSGLQNQQFQRWWEGRGHRVHEMPSFQREDNDRCENAHYILLINLTMRARRSRLTRVASVERAYVQGRGCGNEREREERGSEKCGREEGGGGRRSEVPFCS